MTAGRSINSISHHWGTPQKYIDAILEVFDVTKIDLDPCSNEFSLVKARIEYKLPENDGLKENWEFRTIYVNPPYGTDKTRGTSIKNWLRKCHETRIQFGSEIIALIPVATNTSHWKKYVWVSADAIAFLSDTRLKFLIDGKGGGKGAPMSCAMVYWGSNVKRFYEVFSRYGAVVSTIENKAFQNELEDPQIDLFGSKNLRLVG